MFRSLLVPLDGSAAAEHALPMALSLARRFEATLKIVHVHAFVWGAYGEGGLHDEIVDREIARADASLPRRNNPAPFRGDKRLAEFSPIGWARSGRAQPARHGSGCRLDRHDHTWARPCSSILAGKCGRCSDPSSDYPDVVCATRGVGNRLHPGAGNWAGANPVRWVATRRTDFRAGSCSRGRDATPNSRCSALSSSGCRTAIHRTTAE